MRTIFSLASIVGVFGLLTACNAVSVAKLEPTALVNNPAGSQQLDIKGLKLFSDEYTIGSWSGKFEQSASGVRILNSFERDKSKSNFTVNGPGFANTVKAKCQARSARNPIPIYSRKNNDGSFSCTFETIDELNNKVTIGELALGPASTGGFIDVQTGLGLAGQISIGTTQLVIKSEHKAANALIPSDKPLGYSLSLFGQNIALIDVNNQSATLPLGDEEEKFQAALLGVLALVFFQDVRDGDSLS